MESGRRPRAEVEKIAALCKENIDRIVDVYYETDPQNGAKSEKNKFAKAQETILLARSYVSFFTQWAEAQIIGYYQSGSKNPDSHKHEGSDKYDNVEAYRSAIARILDTSFPSHVVGYNSPQYHAWREALVEGLHALNHGEVVSLLIPKVHKRASNKYTTDKLKIAAVLHVYRHWERLGKKSLALEYVAQKIHFSEESIRQWEKEILNKSDPEKLRRKAIRTGFLISLERNREKKRLKRELTPEEFAFAHFDLNKKFNSSDLAHHDMLLFEFPLESIGKTIRSVKSGK